MGAPLNGLAAQDLMEVLKVGRTALECNTVDEMIPEMLRQLEAVFEAGNSTFFFARHPAKGIDLDRVITMGIEDNFLIQFRDYYHRLDPFLKVFQTTSPPVLTTEQIIPFRDLIRREYYNDFLRLQSIHYQMSIYLKSEGTLLGVLSLFRPKKGKHFSSQEKAKAALMVPYLAGALKKNLMSHKMIERKPSVDSIITALPHLGVMVMDASADPIYQDENAVRIISDLNMDKRQFLGASFKPLPEEIHMRCKKLLRVAQQANTFESCQDQFYLVPPGGEQKVSVHLRLITWRRKKPLLLLYLDPQESLLCFLKRTRKHDLTGREIEVISLLSEGLTNKEIAENLFISENTVENHLKSIYRKMDVTNRTSVVRRLLQMNSITTQVSDSKKKS
jgi:DNA-binding CsgD family transcriptional regulator